MNAPYRTGVALVCLTLFSLPSIAQQTAQQEASATPAPVHHMVLDVVVTDGAKKPVAGLQQQDFIVLDNKKPQKILSFIPHGVNEAQSAQSDPPAKIILLVDEVNTRFDRVAYERDQIKKFAMQNNGKLPHPVSLAFFTDTGSQLGKGSTQDGRQLLAALDDHESKLRTLRRSEGFYGAVDRFQLSLSTLSSLAAAEAQRPGRKMIVWISPGWAYFSGPNQQYLTRKQEQGLFASIVAVSNELRRARITLYSIDPLGVSDAGSLRVNYYQEFLKPALKSNDVQGGDLALQVLATQTGGLALNSSNDIAAQIDKCVADADAYYTLIFDPPPSEQPNEFHAIDVKIETPGLTARTRNGYYGQP